MTTRTVVEFEIRLGFGFRIANPSFKIPENVPIAARF
jgi:hypothetical protein